MGITLLHTPQLSFTARLMAVGRRWWQGRIERWERLAMEERQLRDAGLMRNDARFLARKPFWLA